MKLLIHSQTSMVVPLKFGNEQVISVHTLLGMWLIIHAVIRVKLYNWKGSQGAVSIRKTVLPGMAIPMLKIRRPNGRLIFNMGIPIPGKDGLYIETGPW